MRFDPHLDASPEKIATFVQEYVRRADEPDAGTAAIIAADLRDPQWLPHQLAEYLLAKNEIQAAVKVLRSAYKPLTVKEVSADTISMDMEVLYQEAKDARQFTAAIACKKLQAEIKGYLVKQVNVNVQHTVGTMSDAQLEAVAKQAVVEGEYRDVTNLPAVVNASAG